MSCFEQPKNNYIYNLQQFYLKSKVIHRSFIHLSKQIRQSIQKHTEIFLCNYYGRRNLFHIIFTEIENKATEFRL